MTGFICKKCEGPAPEGIGYIADGKQHAQASKNITTCPCGYSQKN